MKEFKYKIGDTVMIKNGSGMPYTIRRKLVDEFEQVKYGFNEEFGLFNENDLLPYGDGHTHQISHEQSPARKRLQKYEKHLEICKQMSATYQAKNADYGDSYAKFRDRFPNGVLMRLFDKYLRLETLLGGADAQVKDESIEDTLLDMANYCIMEVIERRVTE